LVHQSERLLYLLVGDDAEKRGLFELDGKPLTKRAVEDRIAGRVSEIGEDNRVFIGEGVSLPSRGRRAP
jgi:hypothetical protein